MISLFAHIEKYFDSTTIHFNYNSDYIQQYYSKVIKSINLLASVQDIISQFAIPSRIAHNSTMV